jgi:N-acyl-D-amino-acid deacylase
MMVSDDLHGYSATGKSIAGMEAFDYTMTAFMRENGISGGVLAITKNGKLVYARGYGLADEVAKQPVLPTSLFRIASISKCFTAAAIMVLVEEGRLKLDDKAFEILRVSPPQGQAQDPRISRITVRQLLQHVSGWDVHVFDPMFHNRTIAESFRLLPPADQTATIRFMLGRPLDFDPGHAVRAINERPLLAFPSFSTLAVGQSTRRMDPLCLKRSSVASSV